MPLGFVRHRLELWPPDILDSLDTTTTLPVRVRVRLQVSIEDALTIYLQKHIGHSPRGSDLSSESELDSSKQDEDRRGYSDDSRSTELEEWHGFQDTTVDSVDRDGELEPALSSDSRPVPVPSSSGTPRPSL